MAQAGPLALDGSVQRITLNGREITYRLQDIEALPDLYLTRLEVFEQLFGDHPVLNADSVRWFRENVGRGEVFTVEQALRVITPDGAELTDLVKQITLNATDGEVNIERTPKVTQLTESAAALARRKRWSDPIILGLVDWP